MAVLVLRFCARAFSSCGEQGPLFIAVPRPLTIVASPVAEHGLQTCRLSNCGSWAQLLRGMWDLPRPGLEPVSPALAGRLSTTVPPGKPRICILIGSQVIPVHVQISKALDSIVLRYPPTSAYRSSWKLALETIMKKAPGFLLLASENSYLGVGKALNWEGAAV